MKSNSTMISPGRHTGHCGRKRVRRYEHTISVCLVEHEPSAEPTQLKH